MLTPHTIDDIRKQIDYDPDTGLVKRKIYRGTKTNQGWFAGTNAGRSGHYHIRVFGKLYYVHRLAWLLSYNEWPTKEIDHIDGDGGNNKLSNLRDVTRQDNAKNRKIPTNNTTNVLGVTWNVKNNHYIASINTGGRVLYLGCFLHLNHAVAARKKAEKEHNYHVNHGRD